MRLAALAALQQKSGAPPVVLFTAQGSERIAVEAMRRGWMPALDEAWPGLRELAQRKGTGKALVKARELLAELASA